MSKKIIAKNISALAMIQVANYVLPLLSVPYLLRVIGVKNFGLIAYGIAVTQFLVVVTDFGFNLTATRDVSINRDSSDHINRIISGVYAAKLFLLILSALFLCVALYCVGLEGSSAIYWACFLMPVGNFLFPGWLFQGLEKMSFVTVVNVTAKTLCVGAIFVFVRSQDDVVRAAALQSGGAFIAGVLSIFLIRRAHPGFCWVFPSKRQVKDLLADGKHVFASQLSAFMVTGSQMLILGMYHGAGSVGHYAVAEKLIKAANSAQSPVCNAIFPRSSSLFASSRTDGVRFVGKIAKLFAPVLLLGCLFLFVFAGWVIRIVSGSELDESVLVLRILSFIPLSVFLDNLLGTQILLNIGCGKQFMRAILLSGLVGLLVAVLFVERFGAVASAAAYLLAQLSVLVMMYFYARKSGVVVGKSI